MPRLPVRRSCWRSSSAPRENAESETILAVGGSDTSPERQRRDTGAPGWCRDGHDRRKVILQTPRTIQWVGDSGGFVRFIDQTLLPTTLQYRDCRTLEEVWEAIRSLRVRGAPAIGIAAAMGVVVGLQG